MSRSFFSLHQVLKAKLVASYRPACIRSGTDAAQSWLIQKKWANGRMELSSCCGMMVTKVVLILTESVPI